MNKENVFFTRKPLIGGLVNSATEICFSNGAKLVYEKTPTIPVELLPLINRDSEEASRVSFRQIQISPNKFVIAEKISRFLTANHIDHSSVVKTRSGTTCGSTFIQFIDGTDGESVPENNQSDVWDTIGFLLAQIHQLPAEIIAKDIGIDWENITSDEWLNNRSKFLTERLKNLGAGIDREAITKAVAKTLNLIPKIERPICLTYDDPKPGSIIYDKLGKPTIIDLEAFMIGHRIIDGLGRALYWGPLGIPLSKGEKPDPSARTKVLEGYNRGVSEGMRISEKDMDIWCLATELFWLPDVIGVHLLLPKAPAARRQDVQRRITNLSNLVKNINGDNISEAIRISLS